MSINHIIPEHQLTEVEEVELVKIFSQPVVIKYLRTLGIEDSKELLAMNILDMSDRDIATRHHHVAGKLAVISTLLSISNPQ